MSTQSVNAPSPTPVPSAAGSKPDARGAGFEQLVDGVSEGGAEDVRIRDQTEASSPAPADAPNANSILVGLFAVALAAPSIAPVAEEGASAGPAISGAVAPAQAPGASPSSIPVPNSSLETSRGPVAKDAVVGATAPRADSPGAASLATALQAQAEGVAAAGPKRSAALDEAKRALAEAGVVTLKGESGEEAPKLAAPGSQATSSSEGRTGVAAAPQVEGAKGHVDATKAKSKKHDAAKVEAAQTAALGGEAGQIDEAGGGGGEAAQPVSDAKPADAARIDGARPGQAPERIQTSAAPATPSAQSAPTVPSLAASAAAQVANQIATHASSRRTRFEVQLDPGDLGRVDVRLDIQHDGRVATRLIVERPETLDLLRNDARELSRTLEQAGFQLGQGGLAFQLRDGRQTYAGQEFAASSGAASGEDDNDELPPVAAVYGRSATSGGGVDIKA